MRVIAGKYKGRRLGAPKGDIARPTTDKVKEAMFGALQFELAGADVLDAFAGSGSLGLEALSRGAAHVDFVEKNPVCLRALRANLEAVGAGNHRVIKGDIIKRMDALGTYDIVFLDPPYDAGLYLPALAALRDAGRLRSGCKLVVEARAQFDFEPPKGYTLIKRKAYGDTALWFLEVGE